MRTNARGVAQTAAWALLLGVPGAILVVRGLGRMEQVRLWTLVGALFVVALYPLFRAGRRRAFDPFNARNVFLGLFLMHNGVWTASILLTGEPRFLPPLEAWSSTLLWALLYALAALLAFHTGYSLRAGAALARRAPHLAEEWNWSGVKVLAPALLAGGVASFAYLMRLSGGLMEYLSDLGTNRTEGLVGKWYFVWGATQMVTLSLLLSYIGFLRTRARMFLLLSAAGTVLLLLMAFSIGYRSFVVLPLIQLVVLYHYLRKRLRPGVPLFAAGTLLILLMILYSQWRDNPVATPEQGLERAAEIASDGEFWTQLPRLTLQRFYGIESFVAVLDSVPRNVDFEWGGNSLLEIATAPVPRVWWPAKITPISIRFADTFFAGKVPRGGGGILSTWLGELYWNFHLAGILVGSLLLGVFCRFCYHYMLRDGTPTGVLLYSFAFVLVFWLTEAPTDALITLFSSLIPALACLLCIVPYRISTLARHHGSAPLLPGPDRGLVP